MTRSNKAKREARRDPKKVAELEETEQAKELLQRKVSAKEGLLRQLLDQCRTLNQDCEGTIHFVEREVPSRISAERARAADLTRQLEACNAAIAELAKDGQEASTRLQAMQEELAAKKLHVKGMYAKVKEDVERVNVLEEKAAKLREELTMKSSNSSSSGGGGGGGAAAVPRTALALADPLADLLRFFVCA